MKSKIILLTTAILTVLFVGCAKKPATLPKTTTPKVASTVPATLPKTTPNVVNTSPAPNPTLKVENTTPATTPNSILKIGNKTSTVSTPSAFKKAISSNGTYIIAITKNLTINKNLIVDGEYSNGKKDASGKDIIGRSINLYRQDKHMIITARLILTAPKLTINSPQTNIKHGTFKGNIYVSSNNFKLIDTKVEGNVYFTTDKAKSTFKMDTKSKVTGKQELKK